MKNIDFERSRTKHELLERKRKGITEVIWSLKPGQKEFIEDSMGFYTEPYLYEIYTRSFYNVKALDGLLKRIHFSKKEGKKTIVAKLNHKQRKLLDEFCVSYRPYKYKIILS